MTILRLSLFAAVFTVLAAAGPTEVRAQDGDDCEPCSQDYIGGTQFHRFVSGTAPEYMCGPMTCHGGWSQWFCDGHAHDDCVETDDQELEFSPLEVETAMENGDLRVIASVLAARPDRVVFNSVRNAIQFIDCRGLVLASLGIQSRALTESLAQIEGP